MLRVSNAVHNTLLKETTQTNYSPGKTYLMLLFPMCPFQHLARRQCNTNQTLYAALTISHLFRLAKNKTLQTILGSYTFEKIGNSIHNSKTFILPSSENAFNRKN